MQCTALQSEAKTTTIKLTFFGVTGAWWKCGASTSLATLSNPSIVALPMRVMGASLLAVRVRLRMGSAIASSQILWMKLTGSTGATVLKKTTAEKKDCQSGFSGLDLLG
jgi:hypothetical protein